MSLRASTVNSVDALVVSFNFPENLFFFEIQNIQISFKVSETETRVSRRAGSKGSTFYPFWIFNGRNNLELAFRQLMDLHDPSCFGSFAAEDKFAAFGDPFNFVGGKVESTVEMLHDLRCLYRVDLKI